MSIISASRRNDIPAFHHAWLMERIREGYVEVRNRDGQTQRVSLDPADVDCLVLWTKDIRPMLDSGELDELAELGISFYVQHTITGYDASIERGLGADKKDIAAACVELADRFGAERLVWRYDPLLTAPNYTVSDHLRDFTYLCRCLEGATDEVITSNLDVYGKLRSRLAATGIAPLTDTEVAELVPQMVKIATTHGMRISACSELAFHDYGVAQAHCIDARRVERVCGHAVDATKDPTQRRLCGCVRSIDIGWYGHCAHNCIYCYANR